MLSFEAAAEAITKRLKNGGKLLIVGGYDSNFDQELRNHPRCIFWDSDDPRTTKRRVIPTDVESIIVLRWVDHKTMKQLRRAHRKSGRQAIWFDAGGKTGLVRLLMRRALGLAKDDQSPPKNG